MDFGYYESFPPSLFSIYLSFEFPVLQIQGTINVSSTYDSITKNVESSLVARGKLWRVEASQGSSTSGNENSSLFLVHLGPVLFVRDSNLLLPVHLSKQHLLWYGYDRKVCQTYQAYVLCEYDYEVLYYLCFENLIE